MADEKMHRMMRMADAVGGTAPVGMDAWGGVIVRGVRGSMRRHRRRFVLHRGCRPDRRAVARVGYRVRAAGVHCGVRR